MLILKPDEVAGLLSMTDAVDDLILARARERKLGLEISWSEGY